MPQLRSDLVTLREQRDLWNCIEFMCGFIVGKLGGFHLVILSILASEARQLGLLTAQPFELRTLAWTFGARTLKSLLYIALIIAFLRMVLPRIYQRMRGSIPRPAPSPRTLRGTWIIISLILVGMLVLLGVTGGPAQALIGAATYLLAAGTSCTWGGMRYRAGDVIVCAKCDYPRPDIPPSLCPECANEWTKPGRFRAGRRKAHHRFIVAGCCMIALSVVSTVLVVKLFRS